MIPGETTFLATMYSFGAMLSFTIAHVSVVWMRRRLPDRERPWKPPANSGSRGVELPLTAVLGGLGTLGAWVVVMALDPVTLIVGGGWMALGMAGYVLYRRHQGLPLKKTVKVADAGGARGRGGRVPQRARRLRGRRRFSEEAVAMAKMLAARRRRAIHVLSLLTVPTHLPLDAELRAEEGKARAVIERAKLICGQRVSGEVLRVRPGQAGKAIITEAREIDAAVIVMRLVYRNGAAAVHAGDPEPCSRRAPAG